MFSMIGICFWRARQAVLTTGATQKRPRPSTVGLPGCRNVYLMTDFVCAGVVTFDLSETFNGDLLGENVVVGGLLSSQFHFYEGPVSRLYVGNHTGRHYRGADPVNVYMRDGELLVVGEQHPGLSGGVAMGRCGYAGMCHAACAFETPGKDLHTDYGACVPREMILECLQLYPQVWQTCPDQALSSDLPTFASCT